MRSTFAASGCSDNLHCNVLLTDDDEIRDLNRDFRGINKATDVLSFALREAEDAHVVPDILGDIAISVEYAQRLVTSRRHQRRVCQELGGELDWDLRHEVLFLQVHGLLHLLGFDHATRSEERAMKAREREVFFAALPRLAYRLARG